MPPQGRPYGVPRAVTRDSIQIAHRSTDVPRPRSDVCYTFQAPCARGSFLASGRIVPVPICRPFSFCAVVHIGRVGFPRNSSRQGHKQVRIFEGSGFVYYVITIY